MENRENPNGADYKDEQISVSEKIFNILEFIEQFDDGNDSNQEAFVKKIAQDWENISDEKFENRNSKIIAYRIVHEYMDLNDYENTIKWGKILFSINPPSPLYATEFLKGKIYYHFEKFTEAFIHLRAAYEEDKSFFKDKDKKYLKFVKVRKEKILDYKSLSSCTDL